MVDYMSLEEQVDKDFERARRRAFVARVVARLRRDPRGSGMVAFDEVRRAARADNRFYRGSRMVEVSRIVGSVARFHGVEWMDAEVTEFRPWLVSDTEASSRASSPSAGPPPGSPIVPPVAST